MIKVYWNRTELILSCNSSLFILFIYPPSVGLKVGFSFEHHCPHFLSVLLKSLWHPPYRTLFNSNCCDLWAQTSCYDYNKNMTLILNTCLCCTDRSLIVNKNVSHTRRRVGQLFTHKLQRPAHVAALIFDLHSTFF